MVGECWLSGVEYLWCESVMGYFFISVEGPEIKRFLAFGAIEIDAGFFCWDRWEGGWKGIVIWDLGIDFELAGAEPALGRLFFPRWGEVVLVASP